MGLIEDIKGYIPKEKHILVEQLIRDIKIESMDLFLEYLRDLIDLKQRATKENYNRFITEKLKHER